MTELLTSAQMRAIEAAEIASGAVTGLELMERAGAGVVAAVLAEWPELALTAHRAVVLCGPGGNGGDGFVVARLLKARGWEVEVFLYGDVRKMPPDARVNYERWVGMGEVRELNLIDMPFNGREAIILDAIFGIGLSRPLEGDIQRIAFDMNPDGDLRVSLPDKPRIVSVDVPSGLCADSGRVLGALFPSHLTVTFNWAKTGHYLSVGGAWSKAVRIVDIGLARRFYAFPTAGLVEAPVPGFGNGVYESGQRSHLDKDTTHAIFMKRWPGDIHKYDHGHALILSGPPGHGGAARLAARGALRIGAGVVTVGAVPEAIPEHAARLDAVMLRAVPDGAALVDLLEDRRINAVCVGPGLGVDARAVGVVRAALETSRGRPRPTDDAAVMAGVGRGLPRLSLVLDADALTLLARDAALFALLHEGCVLTPHAGEFARLFPDIAAKLAAPATRGPAYSKVDATREAAARAGCVVLFKGPDTVIADPRGYCSINSAHYDRAAPWLATAGSGDVLAGFITGLLAREFGPMQAAESAAWLHVECALKFGPGLIAEDLPEMLPQVFRSLGL